MALFRAHLSPAFPDDATLNQWADEGKVLAALVLHAGDVRHADIIPRIFDLVAMTGLKIGAGITARLVHACPGASRVGSRPA